MAASPSAARYFKGNYGGAWGEETAWEVGATYGAGPWEVSLSYVRGETDGAIDPVFAPWGATHNDEFNSILASGRYEMGPDIALKGSIFYVDSVDQSITSNEGLGIVGGIAVEF